MAKPSPAAGKPIPPVPSIEKAIDEATKPTHQPHQPQIAPELAQALQTVADVCARAPLPFTAHQAWQLALDRIANALPKV